MSANHPTSLAYRRGQLLALVDECEQKMREATSANSKACETATFLTADLHTFGSWVEVVLETLSNADIKDYLCADLNILVQKCNQIDANSANFKTQEYRERRVFELEQHRPPYSIGTAWSEWYDPINPGSWRSGEAVLNELLQWHQKRLLEIWGHIDELKMLNKRLEKDWEHLKEAFDLLRGEFGEPGKLKVEIVKNRDDDEIEAVAQAVGIILDKIGRYERSF